MGTNEIERKLEDWKEKCNREELMRWFIEKDHFKVGLKNGGTIIQIMHDLGFKNPGNDRIFEVLAKMHLRSIVSVAQKSFSRDGFILSAKKVANGTPVIYFLIDNLSEERTERHYRIKRGAEKGVHRFRNDKLDLLELMDKLKDENKREMFKKAYASRLNLDEKLLEHKIQKRLKKMVHE